MCCEAISSASLSPLRNRHAARPFDCRRSGAALDAPCRNRMAPCTSYKSNGILNGLFWKLIRLPSRLTEFDTAPAALAPVPMLLKEDMDMRITDFAPLYRSTVGYDHLFEMLGNSIRPEWPPYDIERVGANGYRISMAVAGFSPEEIELTQQGSVLSVAGKKEAEDRQRKGMLHQGLAFRSFKQSFNLADHVKAVGANLVNGMLTVDLVRELPEALLPRRIDIGAGRPDMSSPDLSQSAAEVTAKAA